MRHLVLESFNMYQCYYFLKLNYLLVFSRGTKNKCKNNNLDSTFFTNIQFFRRLFLRLNWPSLHQTWIANAVHWTLNKIWCKVHTSTCGLQCFDINMRFIGAIPDRHKYMNRLHTFCAYLQYAFYIFFCGYTCIFYLLHFIHLLHFGSCA